MAQFALPLTLTEGRDPAAIVVGSGNLATVEALKNPESWPFGTAILSGPSRSGKSTLGRWFASAHSGEVIDRADRLDDAELFHRWNAAQERGVPLLLIVSDEEWIVRLPDLRSRLASALRLSIGVPDDAMAADLILTHAARRGLVLGDDATAYLVPRVERSFASIEELVTIIDRLSLERKAPASLSIWQSALATMRIDADREDDEPGQPRLL